MYHRVIAKASTIVAVLVLLAAPVTWAQDNCQSFRAIMPMTFDIKTGWSGPVYAVMGTEILIGKWTTDVPPQTTCDTISCQDTASRSRIDFGGSGLMNPGDILTIELQTAQYILPDGYGIYHATWKIVGGTGRFAQATGMAFETGPFVAWVDDKNVPQGRYSGDVDGGICGARAPNNASPKSFAKPLKAVPVVAFPFDPRQFSPSGRK